jgi:Xaa-Pro dipeptidase
MFGLEQRDCVGIIEIDSGRQIIFIPRLPEDYKLWMIVESKEEFKQTHLFSEVYYLDELSSYLTTYQPSLIYLNSGVNSDSGLSPKDLSQHSVMSPAMENMPINRNSLFEIMSECRVNKSSEEI